MDLIFKIAHPLLLYLIPLGCCLAFFGMFFIARNKRVPLVTLRLLTVSLLIIVLVEPFAERAKDSPMNVVALLDVSESMEHQNGEALLSKLSNLVQGARNVQIIPFAQTVGSSISERSYDSVVRNSNELNQKKTNLEAALSSPQIPSGSQVILLTDGFATEGKGKGALKTVLDRRLRIYPLTLSSQDSHAGRFGISQIEAPKVVAVGKSVDVRTTIANTKDKIQKGRLKIEQEGKVLSDKLVTIEPGKEEVFVIPSTLFQEGIKDVKATFVPEDSSIESTTNSVFLSVEDKEKVLLLNGSQDDERLLKQALNEEAYQLTSTIGGNFSSLSTYKAIILNNIPFGSIGRDHASEIVKFVEQGGGLVMIGGGKSFGLGGYIGSSIEPMLPVQLVSPRTELKRVNVAVELVIDKSQSMARDSRLVYAREAAKEVARMLKDDDLIGVIGFDSNPFIVQKLAPLREVRDTVEQRIDVLFPARETRLMSALQEARRSLERAQAGRKHMIVLTDGKLPDGGPFYVELARQLRSTGISITTVLLSGEVEEDLLREMADAGGGRFYQTGDAQNLPRLFIQDVKVTSGEKSMREASEYVVRRGPGELKTTELISFPTLQGYVETKQKPGANLELIVSGGDRNDPLLASGRYGKGKVVVFTSDANGRWSSNWVGWGKFHTFWSNVIDSIRPKEKASNVPFDLRSYVQDGMLTVDLSIYDEIGNDNLSVQIKGPRGLTEVAFNKVAPGRYQASIPNPEEGRYDFSGTIGNKKLTPVAFYQSAEPFTEQKGLGFNLPFLTELAERTGGKINPISSDLKAKRDSEIVRIDIRPFIFSLAFATFMLEILLRVKSNKNRVAKNYG